MWFHFAWTNIKINNNKIWEKSPILYKNILRQDLKSALLVSILLLIFFIVLNEIIRIVKCIAVP